jgi:tetratricopeptide (TPR) repeat protein
MNQHTYTPIEVPLARRSGLKLCALALLLAAITAIVGGCAGQGTKSATAKTAAPDAGQALSGDLLYELLAAEFAGNTGDLKTATEFYSKAAADTDDSRVAARATYIAIYAGDYQQGLKLLERWQALDPADAEIDRMYATTYVKLKQPEQAAVSIQKILERESDDDRTRALAVKTMLQKETDTETALAILAVLNQQDDTNLHMLALQARYEAQLEHYDAALVLLDRVLAQDPELDDVHLIKSRILSVQGRQDEAIAVMAELLRQEPKNASIRLQYARMLVEQKDLVGAREQFLILHQQQPENPDVLLSLALLYIDTRELDQADVYLQKLLKLDKKVDVANYYLGRIAQSRDKAKVAISYYLRVTSGDYEFDSRLRIAGLFAQLGREREGLQQLEVLAEQKTEWSDRVRVYLAQGEILRSLHKYKEGFEMFSRVLIQKPDDPDLLYARAIIAEKVDRIDITETDLLKVLSNEPENVNALNALGYTLADRTGRLEEALDYIKRAAALVPDDPAILDSLGWVSYRLGKMEEALKWLEMAFTKLEDAEIAAHYGEVLWKSNQQDKARKVWTRGRELDAKHPVLIETLKRFNF